MAFNRKLWLSPFYRDHAPPWPCPRCATGTLELKREYFQTRPNGASKDATATDPESDDENEAGGVICFLQCNREDCRESCTVAGVYGIDTLNDADGNPYPVAICWPTLIQPAPPVIRPPEKCPKSVRDELERAFLLYWSDPRACLNAIRQAVEEFVTERGIAKGRWAMRNGKRTHSPTNLHQRIEHLEDLRPDLKSVCEQLLAVKWLGNAGSHPGAIRQEDTLDAFELIEDVLTTVYRKPVDLARKAKEINDRRGPRRRRRKV